MVIAYEKAPGSRWEVMTMLLDTIFAPFVKEAARTLERTIFPPERTEVGLALFSVEELVDMGKHRHG
jgi:hypothetical protein